MNSFTVVNPTSSWYVFLFADANFWIILILPATILSLAWLILPRLFNRREGIWHVLRFTARKGVSTFTFTTGGTFIALSLLNAIGRAPWWDIDQSGRYKLILCALLMGTVCAGLIISTEWERFQKRAQAR